jgi:hypothetical protein
MLQFNNEKQLIRIMQKIEKSIFIDDNMILVQNSVQVITILRIDRAVILKCLHKTLAATFVATLGTIGTLPLHDHATLNHALTPPEVKISRTGWTAFVPESTVPTPPERIDHLVVIEKRRVNAFLPEANLAERWKHLLDEWIKVLNMVNKMPFPCHFRQTDHTTDDFKSLLDTDFAMINPSQHREMPRWFLVNSKEDQERNQ